MMSKPLVLITGATGHLGFRTLVLALEQGYRARIAVRRLEQGEKIKTAASIQPYLDAIEFVEVPDMTVPDAYFEAVQGVEFVVHVASPIHTTFSAEQTDWKTQLEDPAEKGTISILEAAKREPRVKRAVITSTTVVLELKEGKDRIGLHDFKALPDEETRRAERSAGAAYGSAKVMAHIVGDKFIESKSGKFDLIRILPGYIQGANELYTSAEQMRDGSQTGSNEGSINTALGTTVGHKRVTTQVWLDDVAKAHVVALQSEKIKNGDNLVVVGNGGDSVAWSDVVPVIKESFPAAVEQGLLDPKVEDESFMQHFDVSSSEEALGFKFAGPQTWVKSIVGQYVELAGKK